MSIEMSALLEALKRVDELKAENVELKEIIMWVMHSISHNDMNASLCLTMYDLLKDKLKDKGVTSIA